VIVVTRGIQKKEIKLTTLVEIGDRHWLLWDFYNEVIKTMQTEKTEHMHVNKEGNEYIGERERDCVWYL
jgi:hypothetical protein